MVIPGLEPLLWRVRDKYGLAGLAVFLVAGWGIWMYVADQAEISRLRTQIGKLDACIMGDAPCPPRPGQPQQVPPAE